MRLRVQGEWLPWLSTGLLALLCAALAVLQYRWTGEIAAAQRVTLQEELQSRLTASSRAFNDNVSSALRDLTPMEGQIRQWGREAAWSAQYLRWKGSHGHLLRVAGLETRDAGLLALDLQSGHLSPVDSLPDKRTPDVFELPAGEDVLDVALDLDYFRSTLIPEVLNTYVANNGAMDYDFEVVAAGNPATLIYASFPVAGPNAGQTWDTADASTPLLDQRPNGGGGRPGRFGRGPGRWRLLARHKAGSLEALVANTQRRNLAVSGAVLLLILGTVAMLIRYSRQAQHLAELQMNFVTGVSHELRTPLTVIRTAAWNLRNPDLRRNEDRVERYGKMIEAEAGKLESLVNQVMRFAGARAGQAVRDREPVAIAELIEAEVASMRGMIDGQGIQLEERIDPDLPMVMGDRDALRQALRNLLDNALKYGVGSSKWIGIEARSIGGSDGRFVGNFVEICVADRGPGIPADEQRRIFEPFFRGRRAIGDQIHGTGLGLNLVKTIVDGHGGSVYVERGTSPGARFIVRLPAGSRELQTGEAA
jgi:signal transduction histidine kinase